MDSRRRRRLLKSITTVGLIGVAGCSNDNTGENQGGDSQVVDTGSQESKTQAKTPTTTLTPTKTVTSTSTTTKTTTTTTEPPKAQQSKLLDDIVDEFEHFGEAVDVSKDGKTVLVGGYSGDPLGDDGGRAYVFTWSGSSWKLEAVLAAEDGDESDQFGGSVALSSGGNVAIIAASKDEDPNGLDSGAAYAFERQTGSWSQAAKLLPEDGDSYESFARYVAVTADGSKAYITKHDEEESADTNALGSVYEFSRSDGTWGQTAKIAPDSMEERQQLGSSVAISGDGSTLLVGQSDIFDENIQGTVFVFELNGGSWSKTTSWQPDDVSSKGGFGSHLDISEDGTQAIVGAWTDNSANGESAGSTYALKKSNGSWSKQTQLLPDDGDSNDNFGCSVSVSADGGIAVIGAYGDEDPNGEASGSAYVFKQSSGSWSLAAKLSADDGKQQDWFGDSVAIAGNGSIIVVGAPNQSNSSGEEAGSAYVFD